MLGLLSRSLFERAIEVARWELGGMEPQSTAPRLASNSDGTFGNETAEFRIETFGASGPTTYVVTVSEVRRHV